MVTTSNRTRLGNRETEATPFEEGPVARSLEAQTAKLPSDTFLWPAVGAMAAALLLQATGRKNAGVFLGQWIAPLLILGLYNKIVKVAGSDRTHASPVS